MSQARIFVSHSSADNEFCEALVKALRSAGADVWYDQQNLGAGQLTEEITRELRSRPAFVVVLSRAAFASPWVRAECQWAFNLHQREPNRIILPVVGQRIDPGDFDSMLYLESFKRVEAPGNEPYPPAEAIHQALHLLGIAAPKDIVPTTDSLIIQGKTLNDQRRYQEAIAVFERAAREVPMNVEAWDGLGTAYAKLNRWSDALKAFERTTAMRPDAGKVWSDKSAALVHVGRHKEALAACDRALAIDPNMAMAWNNRAGILAKMKRFGEALTAIERAIGLDPKNAEIWANKGGIFTYLNRPHDALAAYDRAIQLEPNAPHAWGEKALTLIGLGDASGALAAADRAIALQPHVAQHWMVRATALTNLFDLGAAVEAADHCLALDPAFPNVRELRETIVGLLKAVRQFPGR